MTEPISRVGKMRVNGQGRYADGFRTWQRTSNLLKNIETDTYNLDEWRENMLAVGLAARPDLVLGVAAAAQFDPVTGKLTKEAKSTLRGLRKQASDAAKSKAGANAGTAVHTATERLDMGESVEQIALPYPYSADLKAYETLVRVMGLRFRPDMIERTVRNTTVDCCGTFDRFGESDLLVERGILAPGELLVVDVKTEADPLLNLIHIAPQLATYANADGMFVPAPTEENEYAGTYSAMPNVSKIVGLVIHVRDGRAVPYLIDLSKGWTSAQRAYAQREAMRESKIKLGDEGAWAFALPVDMPPATEIVAAAHARHVAELAQRKAAEGDPTAGLCPNCAPLLVGASADRVDGSDPSTPCDTCSQTQISTAVGTEQVAARRVDGNIEWRPAGAIPPGPQPLEAMLWEAIQIATDLDELSRLFEQASATGVEWAGPIAEAGIARARIVSCVQRAMHDPATTSKCACQWTRGMAP